MSDEVSAFRSSLERSDRVERDAIAWTLLLSSRDCIEAIARGRINALCPQCTACVCLGHLVIAYDLPESMARDVVSVALTTVHSLSVRDVRAIECARDSLVRGIENCKCDSIRVRIAAKIANAGFAYIVSLIESSPQKNVQLQ